MEKIDKHLIGDLKKLADRVSKENQSVYFDCEDDNYNNKLKDYINNCFYSSIESIKMNYGNKQLNRYFCTGDVLRRRKKAILNYCKEIREVFKDKYKNISIEEEFILYLTSSTRTSYDEIDFREFIAEAAAIFMLDYFKDRGLLENIKRLLPKDELSLKMAIINEEAKDIRFSEELIRSLTYLIQQQNRSLKKHDEYCTFLEDTSALKNIDFDDFDKESVDELNEFERLAIIFKVINGDVIERAVSNFVDDGLKLLDLLFEYIDSYKIKIDSANSYINNNLKKITDREKTIVLNNNDDLTLYKEISDVQERMEEVDYYEEKAEALRIAVTHLHQDDTVFLEEFSEDVLDRFKQLEISNPFETCFAFIYLFTTNNDFAWLINICNPLLLMAAQKLPWNKDFNFVLLNRLEELRESREELSEEEMLELARIPQEEYDALEYDYYALKYNDAANYPSLIEFEDNELFKMNLPQLIYLFSSYIMPRDFFRNSSMNDELVRSKLKNDETRMFEHILSILQSLNQKDILEPLYQEEDNDETTEEKKDEIDYKKENSNLKKEIKKLQSSLYDITRQLNDEKKKLKQYENNSSLEHQELIDLRNLVYKLQNDSIREEVIKQDIELPYRVNNKLTILGGTVSWQKSMKELILGARIIDNNTNFDINVIKNSDCIWIQVNGLSHSFFYKAIDVIRKYNIPLNYFNNKGAESCAREIVASYSKD